MGKMSEADSDRQQIERLTDVVRPPSFAVSGRARPVPRCVRSPGDLRGSCLAGGADSDQACLQTTTEMGRYHAECALADRMGAR